jgi:hypothetical protein
MYLPSALRAIGISVFLTSAWFVALVDWNL